MTSTEDPKSGIRAESPKTPMPADSSKKIPLLVFSLVSCGITFLVQESALVEMSRISFPARIGNALASFAAYLFQNLWPMRLAFFIHLYGELPLIAILSASTPPIA
jgi:hypothetical protein